ncbi:D-xylose ABC transporter ATP-binding protein, partial [Enterococcus hirae]
GCEMNDIYLLCEVLRLLVSVLFIFEMKNFLVVGKFSDVFIDVKFGEVLGFFGLVGFGCLDVMKVLFGMLWFMGEIRS